jgi:hypothetical protein
MSLKEFGTKIEQCKWTLQNVRTQVSDTTRFKDDRQKALPQIQVIQKEDKIAEMTTFQYLSSKSQIYAPGFEGQHSLHFFP